LTEAIKLYEQAKSSSNLVRLYLSQNQTDKAIRVCNAESEPQACFLLARYMEKQNKVNEAIHFYAKAQYYSQAVKLAMDKGIDSEVMSLSISSPKEVAFRSAVYF
jgi:intraflagellar transport protein 140